MAVKAKIAVIDPSGGAVSATPVVSATSNNSVSAESLNSGAKKTPQTLLESAIEANSSSSEDSSRYYSPVVKALAEKHGLTSKELESIQGSGESGRVRKEDLVKYLDSKNSGTSQAVVSTPAVTAVSVPTPQKPSAPQINFGDNDTTTIPMDTMRIAIADHMVRSKHTSPHVYSVQEVDVTKIAQWRAKYKNEFAKKEGFNLSFTPFFLEATVKALQQFPYVNASVGEKKIILKKHINLGCAVALGNSGLIVPVIKKAEERNFVGIARGLNDIADRARNKKLSPDDVAGGTFTVTNPGVFGTIIGTPIISQPQVAILCLGAIKKRPVVIDDMIAIREMCYLTLSYDHRIIDGSLGGQFLAFIRDYLEGWDMTRGI